MGRIMDKVKDIFVGPSYDDDDYLDEPNLTEGRNTRSEEPANYKGNVFSLHTAKQLRVIVSEPTSFDDSQGIAEHLKARRQIIINMESTDKEVAQRILDFISGACYALDGRVQKVSDGVFLFAPHNVDITSEIKDSNWEESPLPWAILGRK